MKDSNHNEDQQIRDQTLKLKTYPLSTILEEDDREAMEEAHYFHTMNAFVELIVIYGWDTVTADLRKAMGNKTW